MKDLARLQMNGLRAVEAAGRLGSLTAAAEELGVSLGAVSQQVLKTEAQLGQPVFIRRRQGLEPVEFPSEELGEVLGKTLGVPLFQEQAMRIAIVAAGFTPDEADRLRRSLATFRKTGTIGSFRERFIGGMIARGYGGCPPKPRALRAFGEGGQTSRTTSESTPLNLAPPRWRESCYSTMRAVLEVRLRLHSPQRDRSQTALHRTHSGRRAALEGAQPRSEWAHSPVSPLEVGGCDSA